MYVDKVKCKMSITDTVDIGPWFLSTFLCHKTDNAGCWNCQLSHRRIGNYRYSKPFSNELIKPQIKSITKNEPGYFL